MQLRDFIGALRSSWLPAVIILVIALAVAAGMSAISHTTYESTSKIFVSTQAATSGADLSQGGLYSQGVVTSYANIATSEKVLKPVVEKLGLSESAADLSSEIDASVALNTVVISLTATSTSATGAASLANATAQSLVAVAEEISPVSATTTSPVKLTIVQTAYAPNAPTSPHWVRNIGLGGAIGLIAAMVLLLIAADAFRRRETSR